MILKKKILTSFGQIFSKIGKQDSAYWLLVIFLLIAFFLGGSSRADTTSLILLRPISVLFCGLAIYSIKWQNIRDHAFLFWIAGAVFAITLVHLLPLPPSVWQSMPGREILVEIDHQARLGDLWRPISMAPSETWNALYSLFAPLVVLLFGAQLSSEEKFKLLPALLALGMFSGMWGILQLIGDPQGPAYFYRITNSGTAVGLFANRNHQALFLATLFPMLAVFASAGIRSETKLKIRIGLALAGAFLLVPLLLVTGSRAGLLAGLIGLASTAIIYRRPRLDTPVRRRAPQARWQNPLAILAMLVLAAVTIVMSRAEALQRLLAGELSGDMRAQTFNLLLQQGWDYFPIGSGAGSFVEIYKIVEPESLLSPYYFNHAHNDWLEVFITVGLPGLLVLAALVVWTARSAIFVFTQRLDGSRIVPFARMGLVMLIIFALGSFVDYALRVPSIMCIVVIALLWLHKVWCRSNKKLGSW